MAALMVYIYIPRSIEPALDAGNMNIYEVRLVYGKFVFLYQWLGHEEEVVKNRRDD